jgi:hypothetical protein
MAASISAAAVYYTHDARTSSRCPWDIGADFALERLASFLAQVVFAYNRHNCDCHCHFTPWEKGKYVIFAPILTTYSAASASGGPSI